MILLDIVSVRQRSEHKDLPNGIPVLPWFVDEGFHVNSLWPAKARSAAIMVVALFV